MPQGQKVAEQLDSLGPKAAEYRSIEGAKAAELRGPQASKATGEWVPQGPKAAERLEHSGQWLPSSGCLRGRMCGAYLSPQNPAVSRLIATWELWSLWEHNIGDYWYMYLERRVGQPRKYVALC